MTPIIVEAIHRGIEGSLLRVFENGAHLTMWDREEEYLKTVREFIDN